MLFDFAFDFIFDLVFDSALLSDLSLLLPAFLQISLHILALHRPDLPTVVTAKYREVVVVELTQLIHIRGYIVPLSKEVVGLPGGGP